MWIGAGTCFFFAERDPAAFPSEEEWEEEPPPDECAGAWCKGPWAMPGSGPSRPARDDEDDEPVVLSEGSSAPISMGSQRPAERLRGLWPP